MTKKQVKQRAKQLANKKLSQKRQNEKMKGPMIPK